jgi:hypothetical protein
MKNGRAMVFGQVYTNTAVNSITLADQGADGPGGGTLRLTVKVDTGNVEVTR